MTMLAFCLPVLSGLTVNAQEKDEIHLKLVKKVNGTTLVLDTVVNDLSALKNLNPELVGDINIDVDSIMTMVNMFEKEDHDGAFKQVRIISNNHNVQESDASVFVISENEDQKVFTFSFDDEGNTLSENINVEVSESDNGLMLVMDSDDDNQQVIHLNTINKKNTNKDKMITLTDLQKSDVALVKNLGIKIPRKDIKDIRIRFEKKNDAAIRIKITTDEEKDVDLIVYDEGGNKVLKIKQSGGGFSKLEGLEDGSYYLKISQGKRGRVMKLTIM